MSGPPPLQPIPKPDSTKMAIRKALDNLMIKEVFDVIPPTKPSKIKNINTNSKIYIFCTHGLCGVHHVNSNHHHTSKHKCKTTNTIIRRTINERCSVCKVKGCNKKKQPCVIYATKKQILEYYWKNHKDLKSYVFCMKCRMIYFVRIGSNDIWMHKCPAKKTKDRNKCTLNNIGSRYATEKEVRQNQHRFVGVHESNCQILKIGNKYWGIPYSVNPSLEEENSTKTKELSSPLELNDDFFNQKYDLICCIITFYFDLLINCFVENKL